jgi:DNA-binding transcriptional LysR family regulator
MSIDPKKLVLILEVAEQGSVSRAAETLHIAQPSLSRTISEFEAILGVRIFERGPRGVTLTLDGERLVGHAKAIRAELHDAEREIAILHTAEHDSISIGVVPVHPIDPLMHALLSLIEARPDIRARFITGTRDQLLEPLRRGDLDLILGPLAPVALDGGYTESVIYYEDLAIYCSPLNRLFGCKTVSLGDLVDMRWVLGHEGAPSRRRVEVFFRAQGLEAPHVDIEFEDVPARRSMVLQSDFLSVFQRQHVLQQLREHRIFPLPIEWRQDERPIGIIRMSAVSLSPAAVEFVDVVREAFAESGVRTDTQTRSARRSIAVLKT